MARELDPDRSVWAELRRLIPPLYVPIAMMTLGVGIILPIVPLYLEDTGVGLTAVGVVMGAFGVGAALVGIPASSFAERRTNDHLLLLAIAAAATSVVVFGLTELAVLLVLARFVAGSGFGAASTMRWSSRPPGRTQKTAPTAMTAPASTKAARKLTASATAPPRTGPMTSASRCVPPIPELTRPRNRIGTPRVMKS